MKNKLLALAVAAAMTAPVAATAAPTVGGMLQVEIGSVSNDGYNENNGALKPGGAASTVDGNRGGSTSSIAAGDSGIKVTDNKRGRLWIKGSEDLGGGMKANYKFEWQTDTPIGQLNDGGREGWVGLSGNFGAVELGRIKSPYKYTGGVKYDPFVTTYMEARKSGGMIGGGFAQNSFWSDSISWKKKFGAMRIWINLGLDAGTGATNGAIGDSAKNKAAAKGDIAASLLYKTGKFEVFAAYSSDDSTSNLDGKDDSRKIIKVGGQFKAGAHTISTQYEMDDKTETTTNPKVDSNTIFLGYQLKMGKNVLVAQIGQVSADLSNSDVQYYALGAIHKFSKTTRTFIGYRVSDMDDATNSTFAANAIDRSLSVISAGLRIDF